MVRAPAGHLKLNVEGVFYQGRSSAVSVLWLSTNYAYGDLVFVVLKNAAMRNIVFLALEVYQSPWYCIVIGPYEIWRWLML